MEEVPLLKALHTKYRDEMAILGISIDVSLERVERVVKEKAMSWPILADGNGFDGPVPQAYRIQGTPEIFVVDRQGKIFGRTGSAKTLEAMLTDALAVR
jgi:hypothetical protein